MGEPISRERTRWPGDEGYDRMGFAQAQGWRAVASWGSEGWDLGSWPYVMVYHRDHGGLFELVVDVEGDIDIERFASAEDRERRTNEIAFFYWHAHGEPWVAGVETAEDMPERLRGPFSWARAEAG